MPDKCWCIIDRISGYSNVLGCRKYIAIRDAMYFGPNGDGVVYSNAVNGTQLVLRETSASGNMSITYYQNIVIYDSCAAILVRDSASSFCEYSTLA